MIYHILCIWYDTSGLIKTVLGADKHVNSYHNRYHTFQNMIHVYEY